MLHRHVLALIVMGAIALLGVAPHLTGYASTPIGLWPGSMTPLTIDLAPRGAATPGAVTPAGVAAGPTEFVWEVTGGSEPFDMPQDVTIDPEGNLWVMDMAHHQFQIFSPDGQFLDAWGSFGEDEGGFSFYEGPIAVETEFGGELAFDHAGNIYVAEVGNQRVQKFAPDRTFLLAWGGEGYGDGQFSRPIGLAVDAQDNVYVADFRRNDVQQFTSDGTFVRIVVERGAGDGTTRLGEPGGLTVDADGNIWVADWTNHALVKFASDGEFLGEWGGYGAGEGQFSSPSIAAAPDGFIYIADAENNRIQVFDGGGRFATAWGSEGDGPGQFSYPTGVASDGAGNVYVADFGNNRVQKFRLPPPPAPVSTPTP